MAAHAVNSRAHPECVNAGNPHHECTDYCFRKIAERKGNAGTSAAMERTAVEDEAAADVSLPTGFGRQLTASKKRRDQADDAVTQATLKNAGGMASDATDGPGPYVRSQPEDAEEEEAVDFEAMNPRQRKLFELRLKLNQARKANQTAIVAEKKREDQPEESRGISKQKWFEEKKRKIGKQLESNGLDITQAYMLDTQEDAEAKYKKWDKKEAAFGWDVFNQRSLYRAYKKRTKDIEPNMEDYNKAKEEDPEFYRDGASLEYGKPVKDSPQNIERMVKELDERSKNRKDFSRRRKYHEEKDVDSINDRNEHFNRKIERAFGKYTVEIKNNLERGTALPD